MKRKNAFRRGEFNVWNVLIISVTFIICLGVYAHHRMSMARLALPSAPAQVLLPQTPPGGGFDAEVCPADFVLVTGMMGRRSVAICVRYPEE